MSELRFEGGGGHKLHTLTQGSLARQKEMEIYDISINNITTNTKHIYFDLFSKPTRQGLLLGSY